MKGFLVFLGVVGFVLVAGPVQAQDITALLANRNIVSKQISCVLKRGPCDVIGRQIVGLLPEALHNNCARCTPQQANNARKLMAFMKQNYPNEWRQILQIYSRPRAIY